VAQVELHLYKEHAITALGQAFGPRRGHREKAAAASSSLRAHLADGARGFGLDIDREVLARLGERVSIDLVLDESESLAPQVFVAVEATSSKDASALVRSLAERLEPRGLATTQSLGEERRILKLSPRLCGKRWKGALEVAASGTQVVVGFSPGSIERYFAASSAKKTTSRVTRDVQASGLVELDDGELAAWLRARLGVAGKEVAASRKVVASGSSAGLLKAEPDGFSMELVYRATKD
jgi:hypothetical protein